MSIEPRWPILGAGPDWVTIMLEPGGAGDSGGDVPPGDLPLLPGAALEGWRGWAGEVAVVLRRHWRVIGAIVLVAMLLPMLALSGLIAGGVAMGASFSPHGKGPVGLLVITVLAAPVLLALAAGRRGHREPGHPARLSDTGGGEFCQLCPADGTEVCGRAERA